MSHSLTEGGFALIEGFLSASEVEELIGVVSPSFEAGSRRGGVRNLLDIRQVRNLASELKVRKVVESVLGPQGQVVRGILFDKTEGANWKVPWHQDVTIAVSNRVDAEGFGPWSTKAGILHVQPPSAVLERMVSLRIHLDDCPETNGALRVIPGSHKKGKLSESEVQKIAQDADPAVCAMKRGGLLIMRPLLIHASSASIAPNHRRVIHLDFANAELPAGMHWAVNQA